MQAMEKETRVKDIMTKDPIIVSGETSLRGAAHRMAQRNVGTLLVGGSERVIGLVTDRDLIVRGLARDVDLDSTEVRSLIDHPPVTCAADEPIEAAVGKMEENKIRRLLVVDSEDRPSGILSLDDVAVRHSDERLVARALHRIAEEAAVGLH